MSFLSNGSYNTQDFTPVTNGVNFPVGIYTYHRRFRSRNHVVSLLNFVANGFFHQQFKGGISSRFIIAHIYFVNCVLGSTNWKPLIMPFAKNASSSSSSPASSCSHSFVLSGELRSASKFCVAGLICCCNEDCATWTKPEWLRPQAFRPDAAIAYVLVCTIVNASAPWIVKIAANRTPVTSEGYELGTRVWCVVRRPESREGFGSNGF